MSVENNVTHTIEEIQNKVRDLVYLLKTTERNQKQTDEQITKLLNLRGQLLDRFKPVIQTIEVIESEIKDLKLPAGNYGLTYPLKVASTKTKVIFDSKVFHKLETLGYNPLDFAKVNTKDPLVQGLLEEDHIGALYEEKVGSNKHYFK